MENYFILALPFIIEIIIFLTLTIIIRFVYDKIKDETPWILNPKEYLPEEEIHSLKQIFYLIMMALFFINILYAFVAIDSDIIYFAVFDILLSLYLAVELDKSTLKNKILLILLIPYGSLNFLIYGATIFGIIDLIHIPVFLYFIKVYYDRFKEYTTSHGLGITIILLFVLVFFSFLLTQITEEVNPLDSLVMVSNAFTSNGYSVLGESILGKINDIILVWGGYILSGVGTATLTTAILTKHFNKRFNKLEGKFESLENEIKRNNDN